MHQQSRLWRGHSAILIACFLWATTGTAASFTPNVSPLAIGAFAMGFGGVLLVLNAFRYLRNDKAELLRNRSFVIVGGIAVAIYPLAFYSSMRMSGVAIGTVVSLASAPLFSVLLERLISNKLISRQWVVNFLIGAIGIGLLTLGGNSAEKDAASYESHLGIILGLVAGLTYAIYSWSAKEMIGRNIHSKSAMASMFGLAASVLLPSLVLTGDNLFATEMNSTIAVYMAVFPMFIGYMLYGYGLKFVEASKATLMTLFEPALATLLAVLIVGEVLGVTGWVGITLILMSSLSPNTNSATSYG